MKNRFYIKFNTPDRWSFDAGWYESIESAQDYAKKMGYSGIYSISRYSGPRDGTGFKPHYNMALGKWIETKGQYNAEVKARGFIEYGNCDPSIFSEKPKEKPMFDDGLVEKFKDIGHTFTDGEVRMLKAESEKIARGA